MLSDVTKKMFIGAGKADPAPPLGTVLGNLGVTTSAFCLQFNQFTQDLPAYFVLKTFIVITSNRTFTFSVTLPSTTHFLNLLKFSKIIQVRVHDRYHEKTIFCIDLLSIVQLAKFKFPYIPLQQSVPILLGSVRSMGLVISLEKQA